MYEKEMFLTNNDTEKQQNLFNINKVHEEVQSRFNNIRQLDLTGQETVAVDLFKEQCQQYELNLNKIIDHHTESDNVRLLQDDLIDCFLLERESVYQRFVSTQTHTSSNETVNRLVAEKMQKEEI